MNFKISVKSVIRIIIVLVIIVLAITSCKKDNKESCKINIYLTDAPALYSGLNIEISSVIFRPLNSKKEIEFNTIFSGDYDLFQYSNGIDTLIATTDLLSNKDYEVTVKLGTNNYIIDNGIKVPLNTDLTKSIVFFADKKLSKNEIVNIWLDIDAYRSIEKQHDGSIVFSPVFRFFEKKLTGNIRGMVLPTDARPFICAFNQTDTFSTIANKFGMYSIQGITPGKYALKFVPQREDLLEAFVDDSIEVKADSSIYFGSVALN